MNPIKPSRQPETSKAAGESPTLAPGTLYLVATPIGNLADITQRAITVLQQADVLLAEDTRRTRKLLSHLGISALPEAYHEHNERARTPTIVERLAHGATVALVSDAGTPAISDPGYRLVVAVVDAGIRVVPIPGASAPVAALVASGLPTDRFSFLGYPPRKSGARRRFFAAAASLPGTLVLLESPHRLIATLADASDTLGPQRLAVVARELTKAHEEFVRGTLAELLARLRETTVRGEITLCIAAATSDEKPRSIPPPDELVARYEMLLATGLERREAMRALAAELGLRRRDVYQALLGDD